MTPVTFDNSFVFTNDTTMKVAAMHQTFGCFGSSILSLRNDLKTFCQEAKPHSVHLSLSASADGCKEQYMVRLKNHELRVVIASQKPTAIPLSRKSGDSALKVQRMVESIQASIARPYGYDAQALMLAAFKRNDGSCSFQADTHEGEWSMMFQDHKLKATGQIDMFDAVEMLDIIPILPITKVKAKPKVKKIAAVLAA